MQVRIGGSADGVTLEVGGRQFPQATDFDDGNWLTTRVSVRAGA